MGLTFVEMDVMNPGDLTRPERLTLLQSGALYTIAPGDVLARLGVTPHRTQTFRPADGRLVERTRGGAPFRYQGRMGFADIVFGEDGDANLLGVMTLEALGLSVDPLTRELVELPAIMGGGQRAQR
ncbi:MAG TPA: hypothetical protein VNM91_00475 [Dehalococcoidia bacterium]|nr:hypothetical protein [Dehalococcoidia bacterium]